MLSFDLSKDCGSVLPERLGDTTRYRWQDIAHKRATCRGAPLRGRSRYRKSWAIGATGSRGRVCPGAGAGARSSPSNGSGASWRYRCSQSRCRRPEIIDTSTVHTNVWMSWNRNDMGDSTCVGQLKCKMEGFQDCFTHDTHKYCLLAEKIACGEGDGVCTTTTTREHSLR